VVANFFRQALAGEPITLHGDGSQTRCFTFVDDTVDGTVRAATMDAALGSVFNVGNDSEITVAELAALVKRVTGSNSDVVSVSYESRFGARFEDTKRRVPDLSRAASVLGYRPSVALEDGLRRTLEWWRQEHQ
jgi:UDP-glucose 4-epimerase